MALQRAPMLEFYLRYGQRDEYPESWAIPIDVAAERLSLPATWTVGHMARWLGGGATLVRSGPYQQLTRNESVMQLA